MSSIRRGDIYYIESGFQTTGSEQRPGRPAIIVSNDMNNEFSSTVEVVYLTTQPKHNLPTHVVIRSLKRDSIALCEQITSVAVERLGDFCGEVSDSELRAVEAAMRISLGLDDYAPVVDETLPTPKAETDLSVRCATAEAKCAVLQEMYDSLLGRLIAGK